MTAVDAELDGPNDSRREERVQLTLTGAQFRESGYSRAPVVIHDLSRQGFRTEWPYKLAPGDQVWVTLPGIESRPARVAWAKNFDVGCKFEEALHPAVFERVIKAAGKKR